MNKLVDGTIAVLVAVVGVALLAVFVSKNAKTSEVITSGGNAFANIIKAAVGPVM
jgi:hypothetical protein